MLEPSAPAKAYATAEALLNRFNTLDAVLSARPAALSAACAEEWHARQLAAIGAAFALVLRRRIARGPILATGDHLLDYLAFTISHRRLETVHVLYLNSRHELLCDEQLSSGTTSEATLPIRAVLKRALELDADRFLVVHNHPSGDPSPSRADREITRQLAAGARAIGVPLVDHIIVSRGAWYSFHAHALI